MEQRVSFITLGVEDLERARAFYVAMGWRPSSYGEGLGVVFFQAGAQVFALYPGQELARDADLPDPGPPRPGSFTLAYNTRTRDEVDTVMAEAEAAGGKILKPAFDIFWGGYVGYFADPDGHVWEVAYNPKAEIGPNGEVAVPP